MRKDFSVNINFNIFLFEFVYLSFSYKYEITIFSNYWIVENVKFQKFSNSQDFDRYKNNA